MTGPLGRGVRVVVDGRNPGTVALVHEQTRWAFGRPHRHVFVVVDLDTGGRVTVPVADVELELELPA